MKQHSQQFNFEIDKYSYLDFIFACTDYKYDRKELNEVKDKLYKAILPRLTKEEISDISLLIAGIEAETVDCILKAIAAMDCIKIELNK